jgi:MFS family permease
MAARLRSLFVNKMPGEETALWLRFGGFVTAVFAQTCGYWLLATAVGVLVYADTGDPFLLTLVTTAEMLPTLILSPYAGVLNDRYDRRLVLAIATVFEVACVCAIAVFASVGLLTVTAMLLGTLVLGVLGSFDAPARGALVPTMVKPEHIQRGLATNNAAYNAARVVGPAAAGVVLAASGAPLVVWLAAVLYAALLPAIPLARPVTISVASEEAERGPTFGDGFRYLRNRPFVQVVLGFSVNVGMFAWLPITLMPAIATDLVGADTRGLGMLLSASAIGSLCANVSLATGLLRVRSVRSLTVGTLAVAATMTAMALSRDLYLSMAISVGLGVSMSTVYTAAASLMHEALDDHYRGRLVGIQAAAISLCPVPYLALGWLARVDGLPIALIATAALVAVIGIVLAVFAARQRESIPLETR